MGIGILVYSSQEDDWSVIDALYFTMATVSTVGYGDISPSTSVMRIFTVFMIFVGIAAVFSQVQQPAHRVRARSDLRQNF